MSDSVYQKDIFVEVSGHLFNIFLGNKVKSDKFLSHTVVDRKDWTLHRAIEVKLP